MEAKIIIFDFEVFKYDTLLGAIIISEKGNQTFQTWDLDTIRKFYELNVDSIWIGHNNENYDNLILQAIVKGKNPKEVNDNIIERKKKGYLNIPLYYYDLMKFHQGSLKVMEAFVGKDISESDVDFNIDRPLTEEEKKLTESYNRDDLDQTLEDFNYLQDEFGLRLDLCKEFNLPLTYLCTTQARVAAKVLGATFHDEYQTQREHPTLYKQLDVKNQDVINYYMNEEYLKPKAGLDLDFGGTIHYMKAGGMHGALNNRYFKEVCYLDVSGYYNLVMINFNLLPRSVPEEGKKKYEYMYHEQLRLKKINPKKRGIYKVILLAVFGAMNNEYCEFCDPSHGDLVRMTGQIFLVDVLEKLVKVATIIQSNTDGIMCTPLPGHNENEIKVIIDEWQTRTGFVLKFDKVYNLWQRDVNNYIYQDEDGNIHTKGEAVKYYGGYDNPYETGAYMSKEPLIISKCIVDYCIYNKLPEQVIEEEKSNIHMFQSICKQGSFDWLEYEETDLKTGEVKTTKLQKVNRAFALKDDKIKGVIYKRKKPGAKVTKSKMGGVPDSIFIYNNSLNDMPNDLKLKIDYQYYVDRAYERIWDFINGKEN